jgi:signal transduction histidine kinase
MEINIHEAFAAIEGYVLKPDPQLRQKIADSEADFERFEAQYRGTNITADEKRWLDAIDQAFAEAVAAGNEIIMLTDAMQGKLERFEWDLEEIDRILDDEVQALIHQETVKAAAEARESVRTALLILILLGIAGALIVGGAVWTLNRGIVDSLERLVAGAERIGGGDIEHRIDSGGGAEFGYLAGAFNRMVENLTRAEDTAVTHERRLGDAIECISEGFVLYGADERLVLCNGKYREFNAIVDDVLVPGARLEDVVRAAAERGLFEDAAAEDKEKWIGSRLQHYRTESGIREFRHHDGRWFLCSEHRTADGGIVGIRTEITELKKAEEKLKTAHDEMERKVEERTVDLERANQAKSEFLATMSHELRTPLNAILGFSEMIKEQILGPMNVPAYLEYGTDIHNSGRYLLRLINDLLDLSKIEAGGLELDIETLDVADVILEAVGVIETMAEKKRIAIVLEIDQNLPTLNADRRSFHQIMLNLLSNAVKFTPEGGRVEVLGKSNGKEMQIVVADTGPGISPKHIEKVLEPFGQVRNPLTSGHPGTGLGLPIVKSLMELHGGAFHLDSPPGRGAVATLSFPLNVDCVQPSSPPSSP